MAQMRLHKKTMSALLDGRACIASQQQIRGKIGEDVSIDGHPYRIIDIRMHPLEYVARNYFLLQGCISPDEFRDLWVEMTKEWYPKDTIYVHFLAAKVERDYYEID